MASAREFVQYLMEIDGVEECVLMRKDGQLLEKTTDHADELGSLMLLSVMGADGVKKKVGYSYLHHLSIVRSCRKNLLIFPFGRYILGVIQQSEASSLDLAEAVTDRLARIQGR